MNIILLQWYTQFSSNIDRGLKRRRTLRWTQQPYYYVPTALPIQLGVKPCIVVDVRSHFRGVYCLSLQGRRVGTSVDTGVLDMPGIEPRFIGGLTRDLATIPSYLSPILKNSNLSKISNSALFLNLRKCSNT